tara:strand:+ start:60379 stop:61257 length:879 start_codon:yes stop_codon:yes gene_type:complete
MSKSLATRIAPTPSGYLHVGNALNFILTWWVAKHNNAKIHLRIDDADFTRCRDEFLDDIFYGLDWLGIEWDKGPKDVQDFKNNHSQTKKLDRYFDEICDPNLFFSCECTRKEVANSLNGLYPGTCESKRIEFKKNLCSKRVKLIGETTIEVEQSKIDLAGQMGNFVVWRKDGVPSYQLTSVLDDLDMGVNLIVRGQDLIESSAAQIYLARILGMQHLDKAKFIHHPLVKDKTGQKISKGTMTGVNELHLKRMREKCIDPAHILREYSDFFGLEKGFDGKLSELLRIKPPFSL